MTVSRRDFTRLLALSGSAAFLPGLPADLAFTPLPATPQEPDEAFWREVRRRFLLPADLAFLNAANLCPTSTPVVETLEKHTRFLDADPSSQSRATLGEARETSRRLLAAAVGAAPEEIVITRNTSEANNLVSSGVQLGAGDEVLVFADNHPSNLAAWHQKGARFGFTVVEIPVVTPYPGPGAYLAAFERAFTPRTRLVALTHVTNTMGDMLPAADLCRMARDHGALSLVDGAQSFGALHVNLGEMRPDFYTGSAHKWPCGPKETGLLFVSRAAQERIHASLVSLYPGAVGISRRLEGYGQRDEAALATLGAAMKFQSDIGRTAIERRVRYLAQRLANGLRQIDGVSLWTRVGADTSAGIVVFRPGAAEPRRLVATLYEKERIACAASGGASRPGVRFSPHFYNTADEIDRTIAAVRKHIAA